MSSYKVAARYAKSILDLASDRSITDVIAQDMNLVKSTCTNKEFALFLKSPVVSTDKKEAIVKQLFGDKVNALTMTFINLLIQKGRESDLPAISTECINQYKVLKKIKTATLITAEPMNESEINGIRQKFQDWLAIGETMEIVQKVNPDIIGGFILEMGDKQCDSSVRRQLSQIKTGLYDKSYINFVENR